jgi:hypothetical protein
MNTTPKVTSSLNSAPINRWLDVSDVQTLPDSPFAVTHLAPSLQELRALAATSN